MKKIMLGIISALFLSVSLHAAITFPITVTVGWDPALAADNVTNYIVTINGGTPVNVPLTACTATLCTYKAVIGAPVNTIVVQAQNMWAVGDPGSVSFTVQAPGNSRNVKVSYP